MNHGPLHRFQQFSGVWTKVVLLAVLISGCTAAPSPTPFTAVPSATTAVPTAIPVTPTPEATAIPRDAIPVKVWLSSADQSTLLAPRPDIAFAADASSDNVIYVNENNRYQQIDGFGASMTDASAWLIYTQMPAAQRQDLMTKLFSRTDGIGISVMRIPMGASDFVTGQPYTYDDMPAGQADPHLAHFSIEHDRAYILPAIQDAFKINPDMKLIASPWSPPAWMKDSDRLGKGTLQSQYYSAWAQYFVKFIQAYQAENLPIYAVTLQNEPQFEPGTYPGMRLEAANEAMLVKSYLAPAFKAAGIDSRILIWDHNWDKWKYPLEVLNDAEARAVIDGSAFHCYAGNVAGQGIVHDAFPDKNLYFTECSGGTWIGGFAEGFKSDMKGLIVGATRNWARTVIKWNLALDTSHDPHSGGCATCDGLVTIDPAAGSGFTYNFDYYTIGQASKFVMPGAYRIASSSYTFYGFESTAFKNPDGSKVLIVSNTTSTAIPFVVRWGRRTLAYTLPAASAVTFTWNGAQENSTQPVAPADLTTVANPGQITVKWEFSPQALTYTLKRSTQPGGPYTVIATGILLPEYYDTQIKAETTYYYIVSAVNELGEGPDSTEARAQP
jgi:glucosylceramidase